MRRDMPVIVFLALVGFGLGFVAFNLGVERVTETVVYAPGAGRVFIPITPVPLETQEAYLRALETITPIPDVPTPTPPWTPLLEPFRPGSGPYHFLPAPDNPEPGKDWLIFRHEKDAIRHLKTGARVVGFCRLDAGTPTPTPGDYPGVPYQKDGIWYFPWIYMPDGHVIHIAAAMSEREFDHFLGSVVPRITGKPFSAYEYCLGGGR